MTLHRRFFLSSGIASTDGNLWKEHRKFSLATLRHFGMGKSILEDRIHSEVKALLKTFDANGSKSYNPENAIYISVSNIISSIAFGAQFNHRDSRAREMIQKIKDNFENVGNSSLGTFIPSLALLPGDLFKIKAVLNNAEAVLGFLHEFIHEHMQRYDENDITDFTSAFIKEMKLQQSSKESTTFTGKIQLQKKLKKQQNNNIHIRYNNKFRLRYLIMFIFFNL